MRWLFPTTLRNLAAGGIAGAMLLVLLGACDAPAGADPAGADVDTLTKREWPKTDFTRRTVELSEIVSGGPPKDGIPPIDRPHFVSHRAAAPWLHADEPVIVVRIGRDVRAYPLQILMFHEIVNDTVGGRPVAVTFCPLCNASLVFDRRVNGAVLDFGTTGRLRMSDLVMYDRQTESWWQQFTGLGIVGLYAGVRLKELPAQITSFADFRAAFPQGRVLSRNTGFNRPYGQNPYRGYDRVGQNPFLFDDPVDPRLPAMERVVGVTVGEHSRVYPFSALTREPVINDTLAGTPLAVFSREGMLSVLDRETIRESRTIPAATVFLRDLDGQTLVFARRGARIVDTDTGSEWNLFGEAVKGPRKGMMLTPADGGVHFAFAWLAFRPESDVYRAD
jgi:hypothetical protein